MQGLRVHRWKSTPQLLSLPFPSVHSREACRRPPCCKSWRGIAAASWKVFIAVAIDLIDLSDGDADNEPNGDDEPVEANGDTRDAAYIEWHTMRGSQKCGPNIATDNEDDEDSDPAEDDDPGGQCDEDGINTGSGAYMPHGINYAGPGCPIADPDYGHDGS